MSILHEYETNFYFIIRNKKKKTLSASIIVQVNNLFFHFDKIIQKNKQTYQVSLIDVRHVVVLELAVRHVEHEVPAERAQVALQAYAKVLAVRAKFHGDDVVAGNRALRSQMMQVQLVRWIRERLVVTDVLVQSPSYVNTKKKYYY